MVDTETEKFLMIFNIMILNQSNGKQLKLMVIKIFKVDMIIHKDV